MSTFELRYAECMCSRRLELRRAAWIPRTVEEREIDMCRPEVETRPEALDCLDIDREVEEADQRPERRTELINECGPLPTEELRH